MHYSLLLRQKYQNLNRAMLSCTKIFFADFLQESFISVILLRRIPYITERIARYLYGGRRTVSPNSVPYIIVSNGRLPPYPLFPYVFALPRLVSSGLFFNVRDLRSSV